MIGNDKGIVSQALGESLKGRHKKGQSLSVQESPLLGSEPLSWVAEADLYFFLKLNRQHLQNLIWFWLIFETWNTSKLIFSILLLSTLKDFVRRNLLNRHSNFVSHSGISPRKRKSREGVALLLQLLLLEYTCNYFAAIWGAFSSTVCCSKRSWKSWNKNHMGSSTPLR